MFDLALLAALPMVGAIVAGIAVPVTLVARVLDRARGKRRNAAGRCARCDVSWGGEDAALFIVDGRYVCEACAQKLRRRLAIALPVLGGGVLTIGALSVAGITLGSPAIWLFNGWVVPPLVIAVAPLLVIGGGAALRIYFGKRANRQQLEASSSDAMLLPGLE